MPGDGQVRITVEAAGVHFIDTRIREGFSSGPLGAPELPMTPGREVAGVVDQGDERWPAAAWSPTSAPRTAATPSSRSRRSRRCTRCPTG